MHSRIRLIEPRFIETISLFKQTAMEQANCRLDTLENNRSRYTTHRFTETKGCSAFRR